MTALVFANILGPDGLVVIAAVVIVLVFGSSRLPKLARGLGSTSREFRKGVEEGDQSDDASVSKAE